MEQDGPENVEDMSEFFNMGGYAAFVWPALGFAAIVLAAMAAASVSKLRASERALQAAEAQSPTRRRRSTGEPAS